MSAVGRLVVVFFVINEFMIIGIFGRRNVGKSTLINLLAGQEVAIVSSHPGTTTDPVRKRMEISGLGACTIVDTAGIDDDGSVGRLRVERSVEVIKQVDAALMLFTGSEFADYEKQLAGQFVKYDTPFVIIHNKADVKPLSAEVREQLKLTYKTQLIDITCRENVAEKPDAEKLKHDSDGYTGSSLVREEVTKALKNVTVAQEKSILHGLVSPNDHIVLVCPIDSSAPAKRMILPQVMAIRDILDNNAIAHVVQPAQLKETVLSLLPDKSPSLIVTDSQAFKEVNETLKGNGWEKIPLTSFSILLARSKGPFESYIKGLDAVATLRENDKVLMLESCSHIATCEDIGRVKIPKLIQKFVGKRLVFDCIPSLEKLPKNLGEYAFAVQCGGCMVTHKQLNNRVRDVIEAGVPVTNYGLLLSYLNGIPVSDVVKTGD